MQMKTIAHVDMDAFFAAVEQLDNPEYRGKPVIVGSDPEEGKGRGVVSASSYEARVFGIHSAMPISTAYKKCPHGIFVKPRTSRYSEISAEIMRILESFSPLVEQVSVDEAFLDLTGTAKIIGPPEEAAFKIKIRIYEHTGLTASIGIASNKATAKIASDLKKPDGITICPPGREREFIADLPMEKLWGIGKVTADKLRSAGFSTIGSIASAPESYFTSRFGKNGEHIHKLARGIDPRPVSPAHEVKSISEEHTFREDTQDIEIIENTILKLSEQVAKRTRKATASGRTVSIKIRLDNFETYTRSRTLATPICDTFSLRDTSRELFRSFDRRGKKVRLVGVKLSNLEEEGSEPDRQLDLFDKNESDIKLEKTKKIEKLIDSLQESHGNRIGRASIIDLE